MQSLIIYCVSCWGIASFWAIKTKIARDVEEEVNCDPGSANRSVLLTCLLAPLIVPLMIVMCVPCAVTQCLHIWRCWQARRVHQDPELTPINMLELPKPARNWLESQTPEFFEHAFQMLEDVRWRTEPVQMDIRAFLAEEGDIFGTIFVADQDSPDDDKWLLLGMSSILQDGTVIETTSMDSQRIGTQPTAREGYVTAFAPENTVDSVLETHLEALEKSGQMVCSFVPEQFRDVMVYEKRVWSQWKHRCGEIKQLPPEAVQPPAVGHSDPVAFNELVSV